MSNGALTRQELEALIQAYVEAALSPQEAEKLLGAIKIEPGVAGTLLDTLETDSLLRQFAADGAWIPAGELPAEAKVKTTVVDARRLFKGRIIWAALAASFAILAVSLSWFFRSAPDPILSGNFSNPVPVQRAGRRLLASSGFRLHANDTILAGAETIVIDFTPEQTRIELHPSSTLKLLPSHRGKQFQLSRGELHAAVAPQPFARPMLLRTPHAQARVIGTEFILESSTNETRLEVLEGKVRFIRESDQKAALVEGGFFAVAGPNPGDFSPRRSTGKLLREVWLNLPGDALQSLTFNPRFPNAPDGKDLQAGFESKTNWGAAFGTRTRGYLIPALTGDYIFSIGRTGQMRLFLSPDDDPANKAIIAQIIGTANKTEGDVLRTVSTSVSDPIALQAGHSYYIEAIHKFGTGTDDLSVTWTRPDGKTEPIPANYLATFPQWRGP